MRPFLLDPFDFSILFFDAASGGEIERRAMARGPFAGRVAFVTGAAGRGLGQAIARRLATGGAAVAVTDVHERRTREVTEAIARDTGAPVVGIPFDVGDWHGAERVVAQAAEALGPIDILVNNAAVNVVGSIVDYDSETFERLITANLTTPWYLCQLVFPGMRKAGGGSIINISSVAGLSGGSRMEPPYAAAKAGLHEITRGLALAGGPHNVRANAVTMGVVTGTRFIDELNPQIAIDELPKVPLGRHANVEEIVDTVEFLASDRARFITGEILNVAGGYVIRP
jgi:NAD(P)-dependent dehydrogenase (short-subunit alcohol dehydrogenase family)